ncbi:MAG: glycosyltransferase family 4 protein [Chloroflexia bacterium]|nr:glycosyltransferase family 4 protein [Chloroflexia bacterium]
MAQIGIDASRMSWSKRTGTEQYTAHLVQALTGLDTAHRFALYFNRVPEPGPAWPARVSVRDIPFPRLWTHLRLSWEMLRRPPDLLFVPAHVLPLWRPRNSVVTIHDLGYLFFPEAHKPQRRLELHLSTLWNVRVARRVIAVSQATARDLVAHYRVPRERIRVVHHGVSPRFRPLEDEAPPARYGLPPRYLLYLGTLQPRKNIERLLRAYARLPGDAPPLVLAGAKGWYFERIAAVLSELDLGRRVCLPGYIDDADLPALLGGAEALLFPSLYEGFGLPALEAMACGVPVVAANTSSLPEVVGEAGLLVDPLDEAALAAAVQRLLQEPGLRGELRQRGLARAAGFSWERCARETLAVLEEVYEY